jgi:hypothetical protein
MGFKMFPTLVLAAGLLTGCSAKEPAPLEAPPALPVVGDVCSFAYGEGNRFCTICRVAKQDKCGTLPKDDQDMCKSMERAGAKVDAEARDAQLKYVTSGQAERDEELDELKSRVQQLEIEQSTEDNDYPPPVW